MKQINFRPDDITLALLERIIKKDKIKQTDLLRKAVFVLAEQTLTREELTEIIIETYRK